MASKKEDYSTMNLYQKLAIVQQEVDVIQKDKSGFGYKYVSEAELLPKINDAIVRVGVTYYPALVPESLIVEPYTYTKKDKKGVETVVNEWTAKAELCCYWVNNDNPEEKIIVPWAMVGNQGDSSQAFGSALTYSNRYFLLKYFHCATVEDDPDKIRSDQKAAVAKGELDAVLAQVDEIVQEVVAANPKVRDELKKLITPYVNKRDKDGKLIPTGNYFEITKKAQASALLAELEKKYTKEVK